MNGVTTNEEIRTYIAAVERHLDDLPEDERREIVNDLEQHLAEVAAEDDGRLEERLGSPATYAAELRASSGFGERSVARWNSVHSAVRRVQDLRSASFVTAIADFVPRLRPAWWVLRGYLAIMAIDAWLFTANGVTSTLIVPIPYFNQNQGYGLIAVALAIWASVVLGMRSERERSVRYLNGAATVVILFLTVTTAPFQSTYNYVGTEYAETVMPEWLHHKDGSEISNICAYDSNLRAQGRVLLYDQNGRPIDNLAAPEWGGETIPGAELERSLGNAFPRPQRIVDPETGETTQFECPTFEREKAKTKSKK